jgi:hypothetical protein
MLLFKLFTGKVIGASQVPGFVPKIQQDGQYAQAQSFLLHAISEVDTAYPELVR